MPFSIKAEKAGLQQLAGVRQLFKKDGEEDPQSFRWDPANNRWSKKKGKMADDVDMMVRPKIGAPYMVGQAFELANFV